MFRLIGATQLEIASGTCENCGHAIAQLFTIQDDETKRVMTVGCECVVHFLSGDAEMTADLLRRRMQRAATQWRKREPAPKYGETRADYINRRVAEMANALTAYKAYAVAKNPDYIRRSDRFVRSFMKRNGVEKPTDIYSAEYDRYRWLFSALSSYYQNRKFRSFQDRIAKKHNANPYDFRRPIWDVRKI